MTLFCWHPPATPDPRGWASSPLSLGPLPLSSSSSALGALLGVGLSEDALLWSSAALPACIGNMEVSFVFSSLGLENRGGAKEKNRLAE